MNKQNVAVKTARYILYFDITIQYVTLNSQYMCTGVVRTPRGSSGDYTGIAVFDLIRRFYDSRWNIRTSLILHSDIYRWGLQFRRISKSTVAQK